VLPQAGFESDDLGGMRQACRPIGWHICKNSGYKGRLGIYQVAPISEEMTQIIMTFKTSIDIADQAVCEAVRTLCRSGLKNVKVGLSSLE
jgi:type IV pilus assembly protein PilB